MQNNIQTMSTTQKEITIAEYDGWVRKQDSSGNDYWQKENDTYATAEYLIGKYSEDLNWLHPVAMKVRNELRILFNDSTDEEVFVGCVDIGSIIEQCCHVNPMGGKYINLLNSVSKGIEFLNQHKN